MVPAPVHLRARSPGLLYSVASLIVHHVPKLARTVLYGETTVDATHTFVKREEKHDGKFIAFAILIPVLVLLSGLFAGLTLGYMSLDETQLHVLSISGTPKQREYAKKIEPIRKNGHLLLITLILANMIVNETLPVVSSPILGGGVQSVVVSTVLIVIFSEIIPQSLCTRYGLAIGANMAWFVWILIYTVGIVSWPVAKGLEFLLGSHHGIMYRRAELKELIAMHAATGRLGGDLNNDTVTIIGATLDLQEKVVKQAMTPIDKVFMLNIDCKLDHDTMKRLSDTGHSRVPVYEEIDVPSFDNSNASILDGSNPNTKRAKKIVGILLVKQCLMLDPKEATPLRKLKLHHHTCVPNNMSLLQILDRFQEGRSHMAVVSRFSRDEAASVKHEVKKGLTQRLMARVGMGDSDSDTDSDSDSESETGTDGEQSAGSAGGSVKKSGWKKSFRRKKKAPAETDVEKGEVAQDGAVGEVKAEEKVPNRTHPSMSQSAWAKILAPGREQKLPDDAVLAKEDAKDLLQNFDPSVAPLGIITLEDVLEELIGEEIYDEFDQEGESKLKPYDTKASKLRAGRGRDGRHKFSVTPPEGVTAVSDDEKSPPSTTVPSRAVSAAASPNLSPSDAPIVRTPSLGQSIGALLQYKKLRGAGEPGPPRPSSLGPRLRNNGDRSRASRSETDLPATAQAAAANRVSGILEEEGARISGPHEKSGPDIADEGKEENEGKE